MFVILKLALLEGMKPDAGIGVSPGYLSLDRLTKALIKKRHIPTFSRREVDVARS